MMLSNLIHKYESKLKQCERDQNDIETFVPAGGYFREITLLKELITDLKRINKDIEMAILHGANL